MGKTQQSRAFIFDKKITNLTSGIYSVTESDELLKCSTSTGTISIDLLPIGDKWDWEYKLYIIDSSGTSSTNPITINAPLGHLINGQTSITINNNHESVLIRIVDSTNYIAHFGSSSSNYPGIINTTYSAFYSIFSGGTLIPGATYRISDYNTSHWILEDFNYSFNTASVEPIYVFATSPSTIDKRVISEIYPEDLIYWDPENLNWSNDAAFYLEKEGFAPNMTGVINYRKDTVNNIEAYYDWRTFLFRRWSANLTGISEWNEFTSYFAGDLVTVPSDDGNLYACVINSAATSISPPNGNGEFIKILDITNPYIFPKPSDHFLTVGKSSTFISIPVSDTDYVDYLTISNFDEAFNVIIEKRNGLEGEVQRLYRFTNSQIAYTSIPNNIIITELPNIEKGEQKLNGFYSKGASALNTIFVERGISSGATSRIINEGINIKTTIGTIMQYFITRSTGPSGGIKEITIEGCNSNIMIVGDSNNFSIKGSLVNILNDSYINCNLTGIEGSTFTALGGKGGPTIYYSNLVNLSYNNIMCNVFNSFLTNVDTSWIGLTGDNARINNSEINKVSGDDFLSATYIYDEGFSTKVMGTTGGSYVLYIDNTGTLQTDSAIN